MYRFHSTWWFKLILAPILVVIIGGIILYLILPKEKINNDGKVHVNGDFLSTVFLN